jgi:putative lipoic acid-binding regulatory protein
MNKKWQDLEKLLNELHSFPTTYIFKFIVPASKEEDVLKFFPETKTVSIDKRSSQNGQYTALTLNVRVNSRWAKMR